MKSFKFEKFLKAIGVFLAAAFALCSLLTPTGSAAAAEENYRDALSAALRYLANGSAPSFGSVGGEWTIFALARGEHFPISSDYFEKYYSHIEQVVAAGGSAVLNNTKSTDNSRVVIALASIGRDPRNVAGYNLTEPLYDFDYVKKQGISGVIFALLALDSCDAPGSGEIRTKCVDYLLKRELKTGGWTLSAGAADPDITSMVIYALAKYGSASGAVGRGVDTLSSIQLDDGGYMSMGNANSESCAQVITALSSVGIDAATDERFVKTDNSLLDAFLNYRTGDGFAHISGAGVNRMATEQGAFALVAYNRYKTGKASLYDMSDVVSISNPQTTPAPKATPTPEPKATPNGITSAPTLTGSESAIPTAIAPTIPPTSDEPTIASPVTDNRTDHGIDTSNPPNAVSTPDNVQNSGSKDPITYREPRRGGTLILWIGIIAGASGAVMCLLAVYKNHSKNIKKK